MTGPKGWDQDKGEEGAEGGRGEQAEDDHDEGVAGPAQAEVLQAKKNTLSFVNNVDYNIHKYPHTHREDCDEDGTNDHR